MKLTKEQLKQIIKEEVQKFDWEDEEVPSQTTITDLESLVNELNRIQKLRKQPANGMSQFFNLDVDNKIFRDFAAFLKTKNIPFKLESKKQQNMFKTWMAARYAPVIIKFLSKFSHMDVDPKVIAQAIKENVWDWLIYEGYDSDY